MDHEAASIGEEAQTLHRDAASDAASDAAPAPATVAPPLEPSPIEAAWEEIRANLRRDCGARTFDGWLKPIRLGDHDMAAGMVELLAPSQFTATWVESNYADRLLLAWKTALPNIRHVRVKAGTPAPEMLAPEAPASAPEMPAVGREAVGREAVDRPAAEPMARGLDSGAPANGAPGAAPVGGTPLEPRYSFDSFVVGKANDVAYNAARTVADGGRLGFNPLFLHGGTGLGKTHLMHAIGHEYRRRHRQARVVYMSAEKFMFEFVSAMRAKDTMAFKTRLRSADLLMIDDVQFIAGKESTQEEFFHTMNEIISAGKRLVITADRSPQDLEGIESRILSRLGWGLVADVNPADFELRLGIIGKKLEAMPQVNVPAEVVMFLARRIAANVRELEGALNRVVAYATLTGRPIDVDFVSETLADQLRASTRRITIDEIQRKVSDHFRIRQADMTSARRAREVARPRQIAMYLAKQLTPRSLPEIGRRFGGRDHTTVIHAVKQIERLRKADAEIDNDVRLLMRQLEG